MCFLREKKWVYFQILAGKIKGKEINLKEKTVQKSSLGFLPRRITWDGVSNFLIWTFRSAVAAATQSQHAWLGGSEQGRLLLPRPPRKSKNWSQWWLCARHFTHSMTERNAYGAATMFLTTTLGDHIFLLLFNEENKMRLKKIIYLAQLMLDSKVHALSTHPNGWRG